MTTSNDQETEVNKMPEASSASAEAGSKQPGEAAKGADPVEAAKKEATANYERYLRAVADLDNYRRRAQREKEELKQFALKDVLGDLVPVIDSLELGLAAARQQTEVKKVTDGLAMVLEQLKQTLGRHGLKEVSAAGAKFDPNLHESVSHQPSADIAEGNVTQVVRTGYTLNGRLVRPASVVVSSGPAKEAPQG